jgi:hypothetical protein
MDVGNKVVSTTVDSKSWEWETERGTWCGSRGLQWVEGGVEWIVVKKWGKGQLNYKVEEESTGPWERVRKIAWETELNYWGD